MFLYILLSLAVPVFTEMDFREVQGLSFHAGEYTCRSPPTPQLTCKGLYCSEGSVFSVQCLNRFFQETEKLECQL